MTAFGRYIVMLGYAGARNALTLAELHREEVQKRFPRHFLKQEEELYQVVKCLTELTARQSGQQHEMLALQEWLQEQRLSQEDFVLLEEDEVFPALWKLAEGLDAGLDVELGKIPILQFVIELCELFDVNPYVNMTALENRECFRNIEVAKEKQLVSYGAGREAVTAIYGLFIATDKPEETAAYAEANGLPVAIVGRLTDKNGRVVRNGEIIRYLTPEG